MLVNNLNFIFNEILYNVIINFFAIFKHLYTKYSNIYKINVEKKSNYHYKSEIYKY